MWILLRRGPPARWGAVSLQESFFCQPNVATRGQYCWGARSVLTDPHEALAFGKGKTGGIR
jgi:hypothetical protein